VRGRVSAAGRYVPSDANRVRWFGDVYEVGTHDRLDEPPVSWARITRSSRSSGGRRRGRHRRADGVRLAVVPLLVLAGAVVHPLRGWQFQKFLAKFSERQAGSGRQRLARRRRNNSLRRRYVTRKTAGGDGVVTRSGVTRYVPDGSSADFGRWMSTAAGGLREPANAVLNGPRTSSRRHHVRHDEARSRR